MTSFHPFRSEEAKEKFLSFYDRRGVEWPVPSETRLVPTSQGETFVRISGPKEGIPLVLLHGALGNALQWVPNIAALACTFRVHAVDLLGDFGRSVAIRPLKTPGDYLTWLEDLFGTLFGGEKVHLMGLSYGGWLSALYALHFPNRLEKLVLAAPASTVLPLSPIWMARAMTCFLPSPFFTKSFLYWMLEDLAAKGPEGRQMIDRQAEETYLALKCFKAKPLVRPTVFSDGDLQGIRVPTFFLVGEKEKIYSASRAIERLKEVAPHVKTALVPMAGHDLTVVQAENVNTQVLKFLRDD